MSDSADVQPKPTSTRARGDVVENIVAMMHEAEGLTVTPRVRLPVLFDSSLTREIDVLITHRIGGLEYRAAIECKNYSEPLDHTHIDEFTGKLKAVGIPIQHGIMVSVNGFNKHALLYAKNCGIKTLVLSGLSADHLTAEIHSAFQSVVFLMGNVTNISITTDRADENLDGLMLLDNRGVLRGFLADVIWSRWRDGELPQSIGEHVLPIDLPAGWGIQSGTRNAGGVGQYTLKVDALVASIKGEATKFELFDPVSGEVERYRVSSEFTNVTMDSSLTAVCSEKELETLLDKRGMVNVNLGRYPLPRIILMSGLYWPPSERMVKRLYREMADAFWKRESVIDVAQTLEFGDLEGYSLERAWDPISGAHHASSDPNWSPFPEGDGQGKIDQVYVRRLTGKARKRNERRLRRSEPTR